MVRAEVFGSGDFQVRGLDVLLGVDGRALLLARRKEAVSLPLEVLWLWEKIGQSESGFSKGVFRIERNIKE